VDDVRTPGPEGPEFHPEMVWADMTLPDGRGLRLVGASDESVLDLAQRIDDAFGVAPESLAHEHPEAPDFDLSEMCGAAEEALTEACGSMSLLDVVCLLSMQLAPNMDDWHESSNTVLDAITLTEVLALAALAENPVATEPDEGYIQPNLDRVRVAAATVVHLAMLDGLAPSLESSEDSPVPMSIVAARLGAHERVVRGRQYGDIASLINEAILTTAQADKALQACLGFTYPQIVAVRSAIHELLRQRSDRLSSTVHTLSAAARSGATPTPERVRTLRKELKALPKTGRELQTVTVSEVADASGLPVPTARAVLDFFSIGPISMTRAQILERFIKGDNPLRSRQLLRTATDAYFVLTEGILLDEIRRVCEAGLTSHQAVWAKYGKARDKTVERLACDAIAGLVGPLAQMHPSLEYRSAETGVDVSATSSDRAKSPLTEADLLCLADGVALCVEAKAGSFRDSSRRGSTLRLKDDLAKTVSSASMQAQRLELLIEANHGLWLKEDIWLDIPRAHEFHHVIVCLDDLGPLALSIDDLLAAEALPAERRPWIVSLHDLLVIQDVLQRPHNFLSYLRRRTTAEAGRWIFATDELDLLMWFVNGGMHFDPDPDRLYARYPQTRPPTSKERKDYLTQGPTIVLTLTDPLDAYMYWRQGVSSHSAPRPERRDLESPLNFLVAHMQEHGVGGWLRAAADLDSFDDETQRRIAAGIGATLARYREDDKFHTITQGAMDDSGRWVTIFAAGPDTKPSRDRLVMYLKAKKHSDGSDRALGVLLDRNGQPVHILWAEGPAGEDPALDRLARQMRLIPPARSPRSLPPRAKKTAQKKYPSKKQPRRR
jgi:hypothetical protein